MTRLPPPKGDNNDIKPKDDIVSGVDNTNDNAGMVPKTSLDEVNGKFDAMTKELDALVSAEVEALPEDMRDSIRDLKADSLEKLKLINNLKAKFNKAPVRQSDPDSKRPDTPKNNTGASEYEKYLKSTGV